MSAVHVDPCARRSGATPRTPRGSLDARIAGVLGLTLVLASCWCGADGPPKPARPEAPTQTPASAP